MCTRALLSMALLAASAHAAGGIGYCQATGYFKQDSRPTLYQPLNLLDGRDATAWCSPTSDPLNELLTFGFAAPVKIDEVKITTGNNFDENTWNTFARAHKFSLKTGKQSQTFTVEDARGPQTITLKQPLTGTRFRMEVLDTYPAEDPDQPVCVTDIVFLSEGKPLNGPWLTAKLKYDKYQALVLGTWYAGFEGSPDKFLSFNFDGTFSFSYEPFDESRGQAKKLTGTYDLSASRLMIEVGGKRRAVKYGREAAKSGAGYTLTLDGELPEELKAAWRSTP